MSTPDVTSKPGPDEVPRDRWFHGVHAHSMDRENVGSLGSSIGLASPSSLKDLDVYGTLREKHVRLTPRQIRMMYEDVRERTERTLDGLTPEQLRATNEPSLNPFDWGIGHIAHFYEYMILRLLAPGTPIDKFLPGHDTHALFDSFRAAHDDRWRPKEIAGSDPSITEIKKYLHDVMEALLLVLDTTSGADQNELLDPVTTYLHTYGIVHEHWHVEDFVQTRHTLGYAAPRKLPSNNSIKSFASNCWGDFAVNPEQPLELSASSDVSSGAHPGYVTIPSGRYTLGATRNDQWVFDAERWAHEISVPSFRLGKACVTNCEFLLFVDSGGYDKKQFWSHEGWRWLGSNKAWVLDPKNANVSTDQSSRIGKNTKAPRYWVNDGNGWSECLFDNARTPLRPHAPVMHVTWYEAEAYCTWVGGRLPTEAEWEICARTCPETYGRAITTDGNSSSNASKRRVYPWGDGPPTHDRVNLNGFRGASVDVSAFPKGDSGWGVRGMLGNCWEWTSSAFFPFPGFAMDFPYRENRYVFFFLSRKILLALHCVRRVLLGSRFTTSCEGFLTIPIYCTVPQLPIQETDISKNPQRAMVRVPKGRQRGLLGYKLVHRAERVQTLVLA